MATVGTVGNSIGYKSAELVKADSPPVKTKLNWFDRWFMKKSRKVWAHYNNNEKMMDTAPTNYNLISNGDGVTFEIITCDGGLLIITQNYDPKTIGSKIKRYVIHDDEDLGKRISEIFSFNALRQ